VNDNTINYLSSFFRCYLLSMPSYLVACVVFNANFIIMMSLSYHVFIVFINDFSVL
jgi:hypothetical protein